MIAEANRRINVSYGIEDDYTKDGKVIEENCADLTYHSGRAGGVDLTQPKGPSGITIPNNQFDNFRSDHQREIQDLVNNYDAQLDGNGEIRGL